MKSRKLLLNKKTVSLLAGLFILYSLMGFMTSLFLIGSGKSYRVYEELAAGYEGTIDEGKAVWANVLAGFGIYRGQKNRTVA